MKHRTKFVVWYHNHTSEKDDEWLAVWAHDEEEARQKALAGSFRYKNNFSMGHILGIKEFRKRYGKGWPV